MLGHLGVPTQVHSIREPVRLRIQPSYDLPCTKIYEITLLDAHLGQELLFLLDAGTTLEIEQEHCWEAATHQIEHVPLQTEQQLKRWIITAGEQYN